LEAVEIEQATSPPLQEPLLITLLFAPMRQACVLVQALVLMMLLEAPDWMEQA